MALSLAPSFTQRTYNWTAWKAIQASKNLVTQYDDDGRTYTIYGYDGPEVHICTIYKGEVPSAIAVAYSQEQNDADKTAFEASYKPTANASIEIRAKDGRATIRNTYANRMTTFKLRVFSFTTATGSSSLHNVNPVTDASYGDVTLTMYDEDNEVTTDPALAVKEVLDFMPTYNYEIIGGFADIDTTLNGSGVGQWYLSSIGVPDVAAVYGGSIDYIPEVDLSLVASNRVVSDGRAVAYMPYHLQVAPGVYWETNKLRFTIKHPANVAKSFQVYIQHFV